MKRLVTANEIRDMYFAGQKHLVLPEGAIITPGAKDLIYAFNIEVAYGEPGGAESADSGPAAASGDNLVTAVARVVDSVLAGASPGDRQRVVEAVIDQLSGRTRE
ncbi:MAG: hypothetical protein HPY55_12020 [Firmicutes bacterium]|nr:hypothetical protein [Bacillota bacterium]